MSRSQNDHGPTGFQGCACYSAHSVWTSLCVPSLRHGTASAPCTVVNQARSGSFSRHGQTTWARPIPAHGCQCPVELPPPRLIEPGAARGFSFLVGVRWQSVPAGPPPGGVRRPKFGPGLKI